MTNYDIERLGSAIALFRDISPSMNVNAILAFLSVAQGNGVTAEQIEVALGISRPTASRLLRLFSAIRNGGEPGFNLFRVEVDPTDFKRRLLFLNENGQQVLKTIEEALS